MFWRILKKDLKRKKTMNVILLLFVILCAMFASAAVNNIIAVTGGIAHYFEVAGVPDLTVQMPFENEEAEEKIRALPGVTEVKTEHILTVLSSQYFTFEGKKLENFFNPAGLISEDEMGIHYFDENNQIIEHLDPGCFYATAQMTQDTDIQPGDTVVLTVGGTERKLKYMGRFKGAQFSNEKMANPFLILDTADYSAIAAEDAEWLRGMKSLYVSTSDTAAVEALKEEYDNFYVTARESEKNNYLYDMIAAYIMMSISVALMLTAFVVLRFTVGFTISEEFREIGVMKAVGIDNGSIRRLYIVKYLAIAVIGSVIGFAGSIPLGSLMMKTVSENMVLGNDSSSLMGLISAAAVVSIILLFCWGCTRKVKRFSPIDAVRSGQTGERFGRKSLLHLGRSKLPSTGFLSLDDVLSAPKQFCTVTVIFSLCILMIALMSNFALTLKSEKILWLFDVPASEAHIIDIDRYKDIFTDQNNADKDIADMKKMLADNGMPAKCTMTLNLFLETTHGDTTQKILYSILKGETDDTLRMDEGYAPQKPDEIAMTISALNHLNASIGDRVTAEIDGKTQEFLITGRYSSFSTDAGFFHKDFDLGSSTVQGFMGLQIHFDETPDSETLAAHIEKIKELTGTDKVYSTSDFINYFTGISDTLTAIKRLMMILTVIVTAMIAVLMERSFISKEKSEIALMKAVGISNAGIIWQHTLRFVIVSVFSCILALAALMPLSNLLMNKICTLIGDASGIKCAADPVEILVICPAIVIGTALLGTLFTALYTNTIHASDTASIE